MRALVIVLALAHLGCEPDVVDASYFCGPNRLCPPEQVCDEPVWTCDDPTAARAFECPEGTQDSEPNDDQASAVELGETICADFLARDRSACLGDAEDTDTYLLSHEEACSFRNDLSVSASFPTALAPINLEVIDSSGAVLETGVSCSSDVFSAGRSRVCLELEIETGDYYIRVSPQVGDGFDCDGDCQYNQYELTVLMVP